MSESLSLLRIKIKTTDGELITTYKENNDIFYSKFRELLDEVKKRFKPNSKCLFLPNIFTDDELRLKFEREYVLFCRIFGEYNNIAEIVSVEDLRLDVVNNSILY